MAYHDAWKKPKAAILLCMLPLLWIGCADESVEELPSKLFSEIPSSTSNIHFVNSVLQDDAFNCLVYTYALIGAGVSVGDINNDGLEDIYFTSNQDANKLYLNKGDFEFEDITESARVTDNIGWSTGTAMIDINNDGWLDIYVCKSASVNNRVLRKNKLYINQMDGTFKDEAAAWGLDCDGYSLQSYFLDYDKDGDLDLYLVNHRIDFQNTVNLDIKSGPTESLDTSDRLFKNEGNHFVDVTREANLVNHAWGLSAAIGDFNNDGWPDIYVANDYIQPDFLYLNNQDGTFTNKLDSSFEHISYNSMGSDLADINNDQLLDLVVLEMSAEDHVRGKMNMPTMSTSGFQKIVNAGYNYQYMTNVLQLNRGNANFTDIGQLSGISKTDWSWAPLVADYDNDGYKDLVVSNGIERDYGNQDFPRKLKKLIDAKADMPMNDIIAMMPSEKLSNYGYKNRGDLTFENNTEVWGLEKKINSNGIAYTDLDNDGDLDLVMNNMSDKATIYRNNATENYLKLRLKGPKENSNGIGAKVTLTTNMGKQYQELYTNRGYLSSVTNNVHFGLGEEQEIETLIIDWDNGKRTTLQQISANQTLVLDSKDADAATEETLPLPMSPQFVQVPPEMLGIEFKHSETLFDDFSRQVLLPIRLSQQGPAMAVADLNKDGLDDLFVGGATGQPAVVFFQNNQGKFTLTEQPVFFQDKDYEDVSVHFFDAESDGDLDAYVVSGGYEHDVESAYLQDRLYLNNGRGIFSKSAGLPKRLRCTKSVTSQDIDNDGDLDLVVGGHSIPGKYPMAEQSYILENDTGVFKDVTASIAPEFSKVGLVNDLTFTDYDGDGDDDLMVVGEWMPVTFFENQDGVFSKKEFPELEDTSGWWNTILPIDFDNDGDEDYVLGNLGENNKFHPTREKPLHIYSNDFDDNGSYDMVLSKKYKGNLVPIRGKECSTQQNAFIENKMPTYKEFAFSTLVDIYGDEELKEALHKEVRTFASLYVINHGNGNFDVHKLPSTAQFGPTLDLVSLDLNQDGRNDVVGIGALHEAEVETIRYDANTGYLLLTNEEGHLDPYDMTGFFNTKNAKSIQQMNIAGKAYLIIANNNDELTFFTWK